MENESVHFSLPAAMRRWVEHQIQSGRYGNLSEYIRDLIRRDQERAEQEHLEKLLLEGLNSGPAIEVTPEFWEEKKRKFMARAEEAKRAREAGRT